MKHSLKTISEMTGYSTATVSRALSNAANVREEVRRRIVSAAREIGYASSTSRVLIVGEMLAPSIYYDEILSSLSEKLDAAGFCAEFIAQQDVSRVLDRSFRGAISLLRKGIEHYWGKHHGIPLVCVNSSASHLHNIYSVCTDDWEGSRSMTEALISLGHRKIGIYGESLDQPLRKTESFYYLRRYEAFVQTMREHDLPDDLVAGRQNPGECLGLVKSLLDRGCTAIIGNGETSGLELLSALHALGVKVPEEVSVMGWVSSGLRHVMYPPLSGVMQNYDVLSEQAIEMLQKQISGSVVSDVRIPPIPIAGASVARCRG